jgi:predicted acyl esterase
MNGGWRRRSSFPVDVIAQGPDRKIMNRFMSSARDAATLLSRLCVLGLVLGVVDARGDPGPLQDPFFFYSRPVEFDSVAKTSGIHVPVRTPDGGSSYIACTLYQPARGGVAVPGRFPGLVVDYYAYHLVDVIFSLSGRFDFFPKHGYNVINCDVPGSGSSPDVLDQFGPAETLANYDLIEWFAAQSYSDGNIGQQGASYGGHTTNKVASLHPPHLKAIVPNSSFADWYEQTIYHGGVRNQSIFYQVWAMPIAAAGGSNLLGATKGIRRDTLHTYAEHPLYDDYWRGHSVKPNWDQFTIPALITDGWNDRYKDGTIENYQARKSNVWLLLGPWGHAKYEGATATGTLVATSHQLAWYDYWLKHLPGAVLPREKITSYEMPDDGNSTGWHQFPDWPPPAALVQRLYFTPARALTDTSHARAATLSWMVDAHDTASDPAGGKGGSRIDQAPADAKPDRLTFTTLPLATDTVIAGSAEVTVKVAFSAADGNLVARLMQVRSDGTVEQVSTGWLKASHYQGNDHLEAITQDLPYDMHIHILPTHWRFAKGSSIRISLSSGDVPDAAPDASPGTVSVVAGGEDSSYVDLPVLRPAKD